MQGVRNIIDKCIDTKYVIDTMDMLGITQADIVNVLGFSRSVTSKIMSSEKITSPAQRAALGAYFSLVMKIRVDQKIKQA